MDAEIREMKTRALYQASENLMQETSWRKVRVYLNDLERMAENLTTAELEFFLTNCCELMLHERSQVRRISGHAAGVLLACLGEELPRVWEDVLRRILFPAKELDEQRTRWLSYCMMKVMETAVKRLPDMEKKNLLRIYASYFRSVRWSQRSCNILLSGLTKVSPEEWSPLQRHEMIGFMRQILKGSWEDVITLSLYTLKRWQDLGWKPQDDEMRYLRHFELSEGASYAQRYLLNSLIGQSEQAIPEEERSSSSVLIQKNMKMEPDWAKKLTHIRILKDRFRQETDPVKKEQQKNLYASHLRNLLRLNSHPMVFLRVGDELLEVMEIIDLQSRADIMQEVLKELEMGVDSANFVATFIGHGFWLLDDVEKELFTEQFRALTNHHDATTAETIFEALAVICQKGICKKNDDLPGSNYAASEKDAKEARTLLEKLQLPGILMKGLYSHIQDVAEETAFLADYYSLQEILTPYGAHEVDPENVAMLDENGNRRKVAFFTASFDPFTARDKAIVREITAMGFDVCLSISLFAWWKNVQPARIRRQLLKLTVADMQHVEVLPENFPVNIRNRQDQEKLRQLYAGCELWLVRESTQLETADECGADFPHIVYSDYEMEGQMDREAVKQVIHNEVIFLQLPVRYQGGTATEIQSRIQENGNIGGLLDAHTERMVMDWKLYRDLPTHKKDAVTKATSTEITDDAINIYSWESDHFCHGSVSWRRSGKTAVIIAVDGDVTEDEDYRNLALMELLAYVQEIGLAHVVCFDANKYRELLIPFGFLPMEDYEDGMTLDLGQIMVTFLDMKQAIRERYSNHPEIRKVIRKNEERFRRAVANLYPGKLILSFPAEIINDKMIRMIERDTDPNLVCVPFGKMLKGVLIPNHITRDLNTEKRYSADLSEFEICEFPEYPSMQAQIDSLRSFGKPIMLVDDLYHKGYRFEKITEMTRITNVEVDSLSVGVVSGRGMKLAEQNRIQVNAVYKVPNMKAWLLESDLYPFVGGDGVVSEYESSVHTNALNSINSIIPYEMPHFLKDASQKAIYELSKVCIENAKELYEVLEDVYRKEQSHILTFERIGEVMAEARYPIGIVQEGSRSKKVSQLLKVELDKLLRLRM